MGYWNDFQDAHLLQTDDNFTLALGMMQFRSESTSQLDDGGHGDGRSAIILYGVGQKYFIEGINLTGIECFVEKAICAPSAISRTEGRSRRSLFKF
ncbi:MAG: hypothetical protein ACLVJ6_02900 [Merdibacter sp.]